MSVPSSGGRRFTIVEFPTFAVGIVIHTLWFGLTAWAPSLPRWSWCIVGMAGGVLVAWHGSFQHETIHGHPTRSRAWNALLGSLPLGLWLPYGIYREQHEAHHRNVHLTDPLEDPESFYVTPGQWAKMGALGRAFFHVQSTLLGRLVLGPAMVTSRFLLAELRRLWAGDTQHVRAWVQHATGVALVVVWLSLVCHLSLARYVLLFVYPGLALTLLRSFFEHRPAEKAAHRIGIVEAGPLMGLLYLNNNLHVVHHEAPDVAWYELPARYRARRAEILAENGGFKFRGYLALLARFAVRAKDGPVHRW